MLKTLGTTESTIRPEKGRVGVGGNSDDDGGDDGGHDNEHLPRGSGHKHQWVHQLAQPRLWLSMMGLMMEVSDTVGKSIKKLSKCRRSVKQSKKSQRSEKFAKAIGLEERLLKHRSSVNWKQRTRASVKALWQFFENKYRQSKVNGTADALSRFSLVERRSTSREYSNPSTNGPFAPSFYLQNSRPPSATLILEIRSRRRRPSPGLGRKCLMG